MGSSGRFRELQRDSVSFTSTPWKDDILWLDRSSGIVYNKDESRGKKWLSTDRLILEYAKRGNIDGMFIPILGDLEDAEDAFRIHRDATLVSIYCKAQSGYLYKEFNVYVDGTPFLSFSFTGELHYSSSSLNSDVPAGSLIKVFVEGSGGTNKIKSVTCQLELCWRYTQ